jgi:hypothetical protein
MFKNREYKSGTNWCFWRWTFVPTNYITRLHLFKTPWFAICLHWLNHPDPEPYLHDHPVSFLSLILRGQYTERRMAGLETHRWLNLIGAGTAHTIVSVSPGTLTVCLMGPKVREWGFHTENGGWIYWKEYNTKKYKQQK